MAQSGLRGSELSAIQWSHKVLLVEGLGGFTLGFVSVFI